MAYQNMVNINIFKSTKLIRVNSANCGLFYLQIFRMVALMGVDDDDDDVFTSKYLRALINYWKYFRGIVSNSI